MNRLLFICTANFYRSRFAEAVFNHHAEKANLSWRAFSRGLDADLGDGNISSHVIHALRKRGIDLKHTAPLSLNLEEEDLTESNRKIALKHHEHSPVLEEKFPERKDQLEYWDVDDLDCMPAEEALTKLEKRVLDLLRDVQNA